ncbi:ricin B-like lectin [Irpex rosettiformis]|uniref:Ricin B-like lectin n=1 Tax=Irpex rosettiformis TaxID=378272 RepID=A0ACB8U829_9APHY|nr:ricin B-like lectin [Irpex rosettiformis]
MNQLPITMAAAHIESGVYFIQNVGTNTVLDLANGSSADGTRIQGFAKRQLSDPWVSAQLWIITQVGHDSPVYTIRNAKSCSYADLFESNVVNGTPIVGYHGTWHPNQHWIFTMGNCGSGYVSIRNLATGTYIDLDSGNSANGAPVVGWSGLFNRNQLWFLVRV